MTTKVDGVSWTAIAAFAGIAVVCVMVLIWMNDRAHSRIDRLDTTVQGMQSEMTQSFTSVRADIAELRADIAALNATLNRALPAGEGSPIQPAEPVQAKPSALPAEPLGCH